ncbi:hypothetical protein J1614_000776 [Plenodomus biglobosus]|nr:hypothetical protein J1614_000776 [Plenodomus biglobosus]
MITVALVLTYARLQPLQDVFDISIPNKTASAALRGHVVLVVVQCRQTYCSVYSIHHDGNSFAAAAARRHSWQAVGQPVGETCAQQAMISIWLPLAAVQRPCGRESAWSRLGWRRHSINTLQVSRNTFSSPQFFIED